MGARNEAIVIMDDCPSMTGPHDVLINCIIPDRHGKKRSQWVTLLTCLMWMIQLDVKFVSENILNKPLFARTKKAHEKRSTFVQCIGLH